VGTFSISSDSFRGFLNLQSPSGVLESTSAYRIPDVSGVILAQFDEGQPVKIRSSSGTWIYVESIDGRSGWVMAETLHFY